MYREHRIYKIQYVYYHIILISLVWAAAPTPPCRPRSRNSEVLLPANITHTHTRARAHTRTRTRTHTHTHTPRRAVLARRALMDRARSDGDRFTACV